MQADVEHSAAHGWLQAKGVGLEIPGAFGQRGEPVGCQAVERGFQGPSATENEGHFLFCLFFPAVRSGAVENRRTWGRS